MAAQESASSSENDARRVVIKKVLVVGDWVVDDYWMTGIHRLESWKVTPAFASYS